MATAELKVEDGAEKVVDGLEEIAVAGSAGINKGVLFVGGIVIGVSVGFLIAKKRLEKKYAELAEDEIENIREMYFEKARKLEGERVVEQKQPLEEIIKEQGYGEPVTEDQRYTEAEQKAIDEANEAAALAEEEAEPEIVKTNIFHPGVVEEWDWDTENELRNQMSSEEIPYVLHRDEYFANEKAWAQQSLTYFEGDDVLADEHDTPVDDQDAYVGLGNLAKFGHGSGDPNTVYVRNAELQIEFEIIHSDGKFSEQRRGIPTEPVRDEKGRFQPKDGPSGDPRHRRSRGN